MAKIAALTLIPAMLSLLGDHIDWPRKRNYAEIARHPVVADADGIRPGFWGRVTHLVMGRPVVSLVIAVSVLVAAALPYVDLNSGFAGAETLPASEARDGYEILQRDFSVGVLAPVEIVVDAQQSPEVDQA
ncbi:hypothetical protein WB334_26500, partial [Escherichia coli]|uniref:hypothetical protein n=1 Tax=Escherichia coli TaxID=562 RepID=UPI00215752AC